MDKQEYYLLLPAIIYGVAVVDLLKVFRYKNVYSEIVAWGVLLMVYVLIIWQELFVKLPYVADNPYYFYFMVVKAILMAQIAALLTPEEKDKNTKKYFFDIKVKFFLVTGGLVVLNLFEQEYFFPDERPLFIRGSVLLLVLGCAFINKAWIRWTAWGSIMTMFAYIMTMH